MANKVMVFNTEDGQTLEGHMLGGTNIYEGDVHQQEIKVNGIKTLVLQNGRELYNVHTDGTKKHWFILDIERGRLKDRETE